jgi:hypothetical protein
MAQVRPRAGIGELGLRCEVGGPIVVRRCLWGAAIVGTSRPEPLPPDTEARVGDFADLAATAISNAQTCAELNAGDPAESMEQILTGSSAGGLPMSPAREFTLGNSVRPQRLSDACLGVQ